MSWSWERRWRVEAGNEQVAQVTDLRVDQVPAQFARPLRRLARVEAAV